MPKSKAHKPRAGISFNLKNNFHPSDSHEEYDEIETIHFLKDQLEYFGFEVVLFEQTEKFFDSLVKEKPDFVLNIAEGKGRTRSRESQVPAVLEWLNIPYYGSDPLALGITLDKMATNVMLSSAGIPVPKAWMVSAKEEIDTLKNIFGKDGKFIVKPRWEGSSKGIFDDSVADDFASLEKKVMRVLETYNEPALIEEFIEGDEITVGVCGNEKIEVLGMMRISPNEKTEHFVYSIEQKRDWREKIKYEKAEDCLESGVIERLKKEAVRAFKRLELKDAARIDFRLGADGVPRIIDINPLPGLSPNYSDLMILSGLHGLDFTDVVRKIIGISMERNNIKVKKREYVNNGSDRK